MSTLTTEQAVEIRAVVEYAREYHNIQQLKEDYKSPADRLVWDTMNGRITRSQEVMDDLVIKALKDK